MSLNAAPSSERLHISFFGRRNAGKSSLVNAVTNQKISLVSDVKGTTTDPVKKAMELLPIGPVVIIDTPGIDDEGMLGEMRVKQAKKILEITDLAVIVIDAVKGVSNVDSELISAFKAKKVPYIIAYNKCDVTDTVKTNSDNEILVSAKNGTNVHQLKEMISRLTTSIKDAKKPLLDDLIKPGDIVIMVTPVDESAPKGRLILPQQLVLRNILDNNCTAIVCKETELENTLKILSVKPNLVVTDSQAFGIVSKILPENIKLTSFSILMARYKGELTTLVEGATALKKINDNDKILISEGCTHHRQCNDIGTVKIPALIKEFSKKRLTIDFTSGGDFPESLSEYKLVVHCGGCMLGNKEMESRLAKCKAAKVPVVNYGVTLAMLHGILKRSLEIFPEAMKIIDDCQVNTK